MYDLSASQLRNLLMDNIHRFIVTIDSGSSDQLEQIKHDISTIFAVLDEKEIEEVRKLYGERIPQLLQLSSP